MHSSKSEQFTKKSTCPPATEIVLFLSDATSGAKSRRTRRHLRICDFCGAEAGLLADHLPQPEHIDLPLMPGPLRLLAESLLARRAPVTEALAKLNCEINALG
jgi:hypothetical protein